MVFRLGIFAVLIVALIAVLVFGYYSLQDQSKPAQQAAAAPPPTEQVIVASGPMEGGALIQPSSLASSSVLVSAVPPGALADTPQNRAELVGSMVRVTTAQGTPFTDAGVIHPGDHSFLASALAPGMRAVTVAVDNVTGANGLIWPGDRVDVLLTQTVPGAPEDRSIAAEVVLSNVRVIATGAEIIKDATAGASGGPPAQTVTLEVTAEQASRCLVASNLGKLSLIVHSAVMAAGQHMPAPVAPVWSGDVSPALAGSAPVVAGQAESTTVKVFQGTPDEQDYRF